MSLQVKCPRCETVCDWQGNRWRPFCSERCRLLDLGCWVDGDYQIAGAHINMDEDESDELV